MTLLSRTPPWKLALVSLLLLVLWVFLLNEAEAQAISQTLAQPNPIPEMFGVIKWILGLIAAALGALISAVYYGIITKLAEIERGQSAERLLRRRHATATLTLLLMLHPDSSELITKSLTKVMENGDDKD